MEDNLRRLNYPRFLILGILLLICVGMEYYFHFILRIHAVYIHLFYIPIVFAASWWGLKGGLFISLFLVFLYTSSHLPSIGSPVFVRSLMLVFVGSVVGVIGNRRERAEETIKLAHKELDQIFNTAADGMRVIDKDFNILRVNETFCNLSGASKDEAVGKKCYEVFLGSLCHTPDCPLSRILGGGELVEYDVEKERNDGTKVPCIVTATPFCGPDRKLIGIVEDFKDITERKRAEEALRESEEHIRIILETSPVGIAVIDAKTHEIIDINPNALEMMGVSKEQVIGHVCHEHVCPAERGRCPITDLGQTIDGSECILLKTNGEEVPILKSVVPIILDKRKRLIESFMDITERKKAEEHIKHLNRLLRAIGDINQLIVKENNSKELLRKSCKILVQSRDYSITQAVLTKKNKPVFQAVAVQPEFEDKELEMMFSTEKLMPCACKALKEQISVIVSKGGMELFCNDCLLSKRYAHGSSMAVPLSYQGEVFGALTVYSNLSHAFDEDEVRLLEEVCEDIGFALGSMEKEKKRKQTEEKLQRKMIELVTLSEVSMDINSTLELERVLDLSLESTLKLLDATAGSIMLLDEKEKYLTVVASSGLSKEFAEVKEKLGEGIAGYVVKSGAPLFLREEMKDTLFEKWRKERKIKDALSVPVRTKDKLIGVFNVDNKRQGTFTQSDLRLFTILASEVGAAIENARLYQDIRKGLLSTVKALAAAVDAKDPYTHGHSERVVKYSLAIAKEMGLTKKDIEEIEVAARLHDVGKIGVSEKVLGKQTTLTEKEWNVIKKHPKTSAKILEPVDFPSSIVSSVLSHHERPDGKGYPNGISKDEIPLGASIIKVADAFDAMTSNRPYRKALSEKKAVDELKKHKGTQFQPEVVETFLKVYKRKLKR